MVMYRQGDVLFVKQDKMIPGKIRKNGRIYRHRKDAFKAPVLDGADLIVVRKNRSSKLLGTIGQYCFRVKTGKIAKIVAGHSENYHDSIEIPEGIWWVVFPQELEAQAFRVLVQD